MLQIHDHMQPLTHSLHPGLGLAEALDRLHRQTWGLPVLDDHQHLSDSLRAGIAFLPCSRAAITATPVLCRRSDEPDPAVRLS